MTHRVSAGASSAGASSAGASSAGERDSRVERLSALAAALAEQIRAVERAAAAAAGRAVEALPPLPPPPPGHKWLYGPQRALVEDPRLVRQGVTRLLFWRRYLSSRRPTRLALETALTRLRGLVIWHAALGAQAAHHPLPLAAGVQSAPAWALHGGAPANGRLAPTTATRAPGEQQQTPQNVQDLTPQELRQIVDWWARYGDVALALNEFAAQQALDSLPIDALTTEQALGAFAGLSDPALVDLAKLRALIPASELNATVGDALSFESILSDARLYGFSDLQLAQLINQSWTGQASLWSGQEVYDNAGIAGTFDITDPMFLNFLREQSGYLIRGIDETTRGAVADLLWLGAGGGGGYSPLAPQALSRLLQGWNDFMGSDLAGMSAQRALMISVTEIARAEGFGDFAAMWSTGARYKQWLVTAGACQICLTNMEEGAIPLTQSFPSGHQMPPAHPWCYCAGAAAVPDTFNPDDWTPRSLDDLYPALSSSDFTQWPAVEFPLDFPEVGLNRGVLAAPPSVPIRRGGGSPAGGPVGDTALPAATHARLSPAALDDLATRLAAVADHAADAWLEASGQATPETPQALTALTRWLRETQRGPRASQAARALARADARYAQALRRGCDEALATWRTRWQHTD